jgi:cathepsin D
LALRRYGKKLQRTQIDGIMGMAFRSLSTYNTVPVFQNLIYQKKTDFPIFAMKLVQGDAELAIGGLNTDLYNGAIAYFDTMNEGYWEIESTSLSVGGQVIAKGISSVIDSASSN